jgi:hypothetical protein
LDPPENLKTAPTLHKQAALVKAQIKSLLRRKLLEGVLTHTKMHSMCH